MKLKTAKTTIVSRNRFSKLPVLISEHLSAQIPYCVTVCLRMSKFHVSEVSFLDSIKTMSTLRKLFLGLFYYTNYHTTLQVALQPADWESTYLLTTNQKPLK